MGRKGFMAQYILLNGKIHRCSIVFVSENKFLNLIPFTEETPHTTFVDGLLCIVPLAQKNVFLEELIQMDNENTGLSFEDLGHMHTCTVSVNDRIAICAISPVDYSTNRIRKGVRVKFLNY